jgi:hypothetical protein
MNREKRLSGRCRKGHGSYPNIFEIDLHPKNPLLNGGTYGHDRMH